MRANDWRTVEDLADEIRVLAKAASTAAQLEDERRIRAELHYLKRAVETLENAIGPEQKGP